MRKICTLSFLMLATVFTVIGLNHQHHRQKASDGVTKFKESAQKLKKYIEEEPVIIASAMMETEEPQQEGKFPRGPLVQETESRTKYKAHRLILPHSPPFCA